MLHLTVAQGLWLFLPAYAANVLATLVGGGPPVDGGRLWRDGKRMLGDGKTWRGLLLAPVLAAVLTVGLRWLSPKLGLGLTDYGASPYYLLHAWAMGTGALVGDIAKSFIKRRTGRDRGAMWLGPDQYDFVIGGLLFAFLASLLTAPLAGSNWFLEAFTLGPLLVILILTPGLHLLVNLIGYKIGVKEVPW
ncbi:MAG: CDP-2,3-bis-(O-geranylgeranyl)-sn-glycerol synthase [Candidatus Thermoplasmatota archaeon]|nr:CDP-2,3-bis-(O-geranylgeranyl)-sn-glycerol synthase [Candidatus Thermoplasmatota archaeon]